MGKVRGTVAYGSRRISIIIRMNKLLDRNSKTIIFAIFLFALAARLSGILCIANFDNPDMEEFGTLTKNLITGNGYSFWRYDPELGCNHKIGKWLPSACMPIGYPLLVTGFFYVFGMNASGFCILQAFQAVLGAMVCVFLYLIGKKIFSRRIAILSAIALACYPVFIYMASEFTAANLYIFLNTLFVLLLIKADNEKHLSKFILIGGLFGAIALSRPQVVVYAPFLIMWLFLKLRRTFLRTVPLLFAGTVIVLAPWVVRNYCVFQRFVPLTSLGGLNLWRGHNEEAIGTGRTREGKCLFSNPDILQELLRLPYSQDLEITRDEIYLHSAISFMKDNPIRSFVVLPIRKFLYYWLLDITDPLAKHPLYWVPWFVVLPFFIIGIFYSLADYDKYLIFYIYFVVATGISMIFFVLPRYRLFIEPFIILFAAYGFFEILKRLKLYPRKVTAERTC